MTTMETPHNYPKSTYTYAQKWAQMVALRKMAWDMKIAFTRQQFPELTEAEVTEKVRKIFLYATT